MDYYNDALNTKNSKLSIIKIESLSKVFSVWLINNKKIKKEILNNYLVWIVVK